MRVGIVSGSQFLDLQSGFRMDDNGKSGAARQNGGYRAVLRSVSVGTQVALC
jgi:hypothetical protein